MKSLKYIFLGALGMFVLLFVIGVFLPDEEIVTDPEVTSADEFYEEESSSDNVPVTNTGSQADGKVIELNAAQFKRLVADYTSNDKNAYIGNGPCVVDFFAEWCGPCKQLSPILDKMAKKYAGRITFYKVDVDQVGEVSNAYGIKSIPTLFFCSDGQMERITGMPYEEDLDKKLADM